MNLDMNECKTKKGNEQGKYADYFHKHAFWVIVRFYWIEWWTLRNKHIDFFLETKKKSERETRKIILLNQHSCNIPLIFLENSTMDFTKRSLIILDVVTLSEEISLDFANKATNCSRLSLGESLLRK